MQAKQKKHTIRFRLGGYMLYEHQKAVDTARDI